MIQIALMYRCDRRLSGSGSSRGVLGMVVAPISRRFRSRPRKEIRRLSAGCKSVTRNIDMIIQCPNCNWPGRVPDDAVANPHRARCPECNHWFRLRTVPAPVPWQSGPASGFEVGPDLSDDDSEPGPGSSSYEHEAINGSFGNDDGDGATPGRATRPLGESEYSASGGHRAELDSPGLGAAATGPSPLGPRTLVCWADGRFGHRLTNLGIDHRRSAPAAHAVSRRRSPECRRGDPISRRGVAAGLGGRWPVPPRQLEPVRAPPMASMISLGLIICSSGFELLLRHFQWHPPEPPPQKAVASKRLG